MFIALDGPHLATTTAATMKTEKKPVPGQTVCMLCTSAEVNELELGEFHKSGKIAVHYFCLLLTSGLEQNGDDDQGIFGFLPKDIRAEVERIKRLKCSYCKKIRANVGCCDKKCRHTFHTNCGLAHGCLMQFEDPYRSYCHQHVTQGTGTGGRGARAARHKPDEMCTICYDQMGAFSEVDSVQSPCCKKSWFHRLCLMEFAKNAGYFFKCPMCNNEDDFRQAVKLRGVFVPDRDAAWELEPNAFAELLERPESCEAAECVCPQGRDHESSKYKMLRCVTCGSHCVHNKCLVNGGGLFTCAACDVDPAVAAAAAADDEDADVDVEGPGDDHDDRTATSSVCRETDNETDSTYEMDAQIRSQSDGNDRQDCSDADSDDEPLRRPTRMPPVMSVDAKSDALNTTVETDNEMDVDEPIRPQDVRTSEQCSSKLDNQRLEPLPEQATSHISKDDEMSTTTELDKSSEMIAVAPVRAIDSNASSVSEVMFIETTRETIDISSDDDVGPCGGGQENTRRPPTSTPSSNNRNVPPSNRVTVKRERSSLDNENAADCLPPQSKRIRRALQTMKSQSKITSFFSVLGAGAVSQTAQDPRMRTFGAPETVEVRIKTERT